MIIIVDTNFLIYAAKYKIDLFAELDRLYPRYEVILPQKVLLELRRLEKGKGKDKFHASLSLSMIEKSLAGKKVMIKGVTSRNADEEIIRLIEEIGKKGKEKINVGTMDKNLSARIKKYNANIIKIRQKRYLSE